VKQAPRSASYGDRKATPVPNYEAAKARSANNGAFFEAHGRRPAAGDREVGSFTHPVASTSSPTLFIAAIGRFRVWMRIIERATVKVSLGVNE